jgi:16S rRNA (adenine1518-N6/adenine1519-N6)-dimethyltransferase
MFFKKKSLGQNFLRSKGVVNHIISASKIKKGDLILEIGPGQGFLTEDLINASENVLSVEKDDRLISLLEEKFANQIADEKLKIIHKDILDFDVDEYLGSGSRITGPVNGLPVRDDKRISYKIVANIPYYITGQIIKKFLTAKNKPSSMTLMLQKEVAERIAGPASAKGSGVAMKESILSLSVKLFGDPIYVQTVKKESFSPAPKVDSAVLLIEDIGQKYFTHKSQEVLFFEIIKKAFNSKRKKIGTTLKSYDLQIKKAKIDSNKRPETIKIEEWVSLTKEIDKKHFKSVENVSH